MSHPADCPIIVILIRPSRRIQNLHIQNDKKSNFTVLDSLCQGRNDVSIMLQLQNRLKADRDFKRVLKIGRFFNSREMKIKTTPNNLGVSRFGFVIGTVVDKRSTVRNRIKRQTREVVRLLLKENLIAPGFDVVMLLGRGLKDLPFDEVRKKVEDALRRLRLIG